MQPIIDPNDFAYLFERPMPIEVAIQQAMERDGISRHQAIYGRGA